MNYRPLSHLPICGKVFFKLISTFRSPNIIFLTATNPDLDQVIKVYINSFKQFVIFIEHLMQIVIKTETSFSRFVQSI